MVMIDDKMLLHLNTCFNLVIEILMVDRYRNENATSGIIIVSIS